MNSVIAVGILIFSFYQVSFSFLNGFPKEQCDAMDPTKIKIEEPVRKGTEDPDYNNTDALEEDAPTSLQLSDSLNIYRIMTTPQKYRRGKTLEIKIRGPEFNALMLQVRKIGADERRGYDQEVRVGEFVSWPASLQPVKCDKDQPTAITNKNFSPKEGITIKWKAPNDDVGDIHIVARFVTRNEYWQILEGREIPLSEFPVNLKNCGKAKSCIMYSENSASCHEDNCDYILTYNVNSTNVEFVLGGKAKTDNYLAVGFSTSPTAEEMTIFACTRAKTAALVRQFSLQTVEEGLMEQPINMQNKKMDIEGDRIWCSFVAPMVITTAGGDPELDFSVPLYQVYMRGSLNSTTSANIPILPSKLLISKKEISMDKIKLQYHTMEKPKQNSGADVVTVFHSLLLFVFLLYFHHIKITL